MSSIKNKVSSRKDVKNKKPAKPSKPASKSASAKKVVAKPVKPTKSVAKKPAPAKKVKSKAPAPKKAVAVKKVISKNSKPVKKAAPVKNKTIAKKAPAKKAAPVKKQALKKAIAKPAAKPAKAMPPARDSKKEVKPALKTLKENSKVYDKKEPVIEKPKSPVDVFSKKSTPKSATDVLAITNTIPVKEKYDISPTKIALISNSITNPVKKTDSYAIKPEKEPAGKFEMEFVIHASADMLYEFLSTPSGLSEWFCDDLNIRNGIYTFIWDDQLQQARLLKTLDLQLVRFQWVDKTDGSYFEFRIQRDDLTNDISLIITDFADSAGDRESSKLLWNSQVEKLMHVIGSIF